MSQVFGINTVLALLRATPERVRVVHIQAGRRDARMAELVEQARATGVRLEFVERGWLDGRVDGSHQGVLADCHERALAGEADPRQGLLEVLARIVAVDAQREHAWFEGARGRQRAVALRVLSRDLLGVLRLARGVARQWRQLSSAEAQTVAPWLQTVNERLQQEQPSGLLELVEQLRQTAQDEELSSGQQLCLERLMVLLLRVEDASRALLAVEEGRAPADAPRALSWHYDWQAALVYGSRSALTFLTLAAFWLATGWTHATGALLLACVATWLWRRPEL